MEISIETGYSMTRLMCITQMPYHNVWVLIGGTVCLRIVVKSQSRYTMYQGLRFGNIYGCELLL